MRLVLFPPGALVLLWSLVVNVLCIPNIGIQKDWFGDDHTELISFSGVLRFDAMPDGTNPVPALSDAQLVGLCAKAFDEMRSAGGRYDKPAAMALLAIDNKVYLASSIKSDRNNWLGRGQGIDKQRPQILARAAGAARIAGSSHRTRGSCGEINIMDLYYTHNRELNFLGRRARIVVWATRDDYTGIFNPCSTPANGYGCGDFLRAIANPADPAQPLNDDNLKVIAKQMQRDNNWPDGLQFRFGPVRLTPSDKNALEEIVDTPYDPDNPDQ